MTKMPDDALTRKEAEMGRLLPCPFCGNVDVDAQFSAFQRIGDDDSKTLYDPGCIKCGASAPAEVWNKRAISLESGREEVLEKVCTMLSKQRTQDDVGHPLSANGVLAEAIRAVRALQHAPARVAEGKPVHTDHPSRHWDRTCPACLEEGQPDMPAPASPAKEQPGEQLRGLGLDRDGDPLHEPAVAAPDVAAMVRRIKRCIAGLNPNQVDRERTELLSQAAALIEKLGQGWIPIETVRELAQAVWGSWISQYDPMNDDGSYSCIHCEIRFDSPVGWTRITHKADCIVNKARDIAVPPPPERP